MEETERWDFFLHTLNCEQIPLIQNKMKYYQDAIRSQDAIQSLFLGNVSLKVSFLKSLFDHAAFETYVMLKLLKLNPI